MNEYEILGGLHKIIDDDTNLKMKEWLDSHNVNNYLLYPLAAVELGAIKEAPENNENLLRRCVASFVYAKAKENEKSIFIKKFNTPGFKKYLKAYESELIPLYQNFRFSREINDINPFSKPRLVQEGDHKYKLTTSLVSDHYREEGFYFYGEDDRKNAEKEQEQIFDLHVRFWNKIVLEQKNFAAFYLEVVRNRWNFCMDLETGKDCFYQEYLMKKYLQESLQEVDEEKAKNILDDFYNFIIQYFDFDKIDEDSMMDGKLLAFPMINGYQIILSEFFNEESIKNRIFSSAADEWQCDIARYQKKKTWVIGERKIQESELLNTDFVSLTEINEKIPQRDLYVFVNKIDGKIVINTEFTDANRKIKKLSDISELQIIIYEEKTLYMNDNLGRLLRLIEANDMSHNKDEMFRCENRGRNSVYLYKALWHFQIWEMDTERIEEFWKLILQKHYLGMVEETETIKQYFIDMQELAESDGVLILAKESYGNDSTLHYLYEKFEHIHGERSYLSWAFDEGKIKRYLKREKHTNIILWHGKPLKKIIFMVDNLMKGGSLRNMLNFHLAKITDKEPRKNIERDYLNIDPTVKEMLDEIPGLKIEIHPIFGFKEHVKEIETEYQVKIVIHREIPKSFCSDDETIGLVQEIYGTKVNKGICCVFCYNNLPAKNVLSEYVCDYKKRAGLFQRSADLE